MQSSRDRRGQGLTEISLLIMPSQKINVWPIGLIIGAAEHTAVQPKIFFPIVEDFLDFLANREGEIVFDRHVTRVEDGMNILSQQYAV